MCDTMVALSSVTKSGRVIFAKNSDRECNEPHMLISVPRTKHDLSRKPTLKATYIEIPQVEETYAMMLLKPSWLWGCEMGANEFGLNIGNEALFTLEGQLEKPSLIGMDYIRIALERCKTAPEAIDMIVWLLETYGQAGNCGYTNPFYYHNAFLIADKKTAWVIETAGKYWAAKEIKDFYVISNGISLGSNYDRCHPDLVKNAVERGWCRGEEDFHFGWCYGNKTIEARACFIDRSCSARAHLKKNAGNITEQTMMEALRLHSPEAEENPFATGSAASVCMHFGHNARSQTTGSYVAVIDPDMPTYYVTGSSLPCISVFKPVWLADRMPGFFDETQHEQSIAYWFSREQIHRAILSGQIDKQEYLQKKTELEKSILQKTYAALQTKKTAEELNKVSAECFSQEQEFVNQVLKTINMPISNTPSRGIDEFKQAWKPANDALFAKHMQKEMAGMGARG